MKWNQRAYLKQQRMHYILKAKNPLFVRIQMIYNRAVDEKVLTYYDDVDTLRDGGVPAYNESVLTTQIGNLNRIATTQDYQRLMSHSLIDPDSITKLMMNAKAKNVADKVTKLEVERSLKNLDYIEQTLKDVELRVDTYKELTKKLPKTVSRVDILQKASDKGVMFDGRKLKDPDKLALELQRYQTHKADYDKALMENDQASREGLKPLKSKKVWMWTPNERTRHENMDEQTVDLDAKFTVVNDVTGDTDYLLFPRDIENDRNGCSNTCNCYDKYTEFFTKDGFKRVDEITMEDTFLSFNPNTLEPCWLKPTRIIKNRFKGYLNHIHTDNFDLKVTDDHEMFIHYGRHYKPMFRAVKDLKWSNCFVRTIDYDKQGVDTVNINGLEFKSKDFAFFMAWYLSEGSVLKNERSAKIRQYPVIISQEINEHREILIERFKEITEYLNIKMYVGKTNIEFKSKELYDYCVRLGYSYEKYIPKEVFKLSRDDLTVFLENFIKGDGHEYKGCKRLFSTSKKLLDGLSYIALLCGYYPNYGVHTKAGTAVEHHNGVYIQNYDVGRITLGKTHRTNYRPQMHDKIYYDDYVYCCELPKYHTLWVRSNGKTFIGSNCLCDYEII